MGRPRQATSNKIGGLAGSVPVGEHGSRLQQKGFATVKANGNAKKVIGIGHGDREGKSPPPVSETGVGQILSKPIHATCPNTNII
jgi:hypothetical protein